jgi:hypothetical protein
MGVAAPLRSPVTLSGRTGSAAVIVVSAGAVVVDVEGDEEAA